MTLKKMNDFSFNLDQTPLTMPVAITTGQTNVTDDINMLSLFMQQQQMQQQLQPVNNRYIYIYIIMIN